MTLLDHGGFVATYKYAVLLALVDLCREQSARDGSPPTMLTTAQVAHKVVEIYWPHTLPFEDGAMLRQNSGRQARVLTLIDDFRRAHAPDAGSIVRARLDAPTAFRRLEREVEWKLVEMPLPRLQRVGKGVDAFLYEIAWGDGIRRREFEGAAFDNRLLLRPGAGEHLIALSGVIRPLIHRHWVAQVTALNDLPEKRLEQFLFGRERARLGRLCAPLLELQRGVCFYCDERIGADAEVDHFVPWARHPDDGVDNLVVAHGRCNGNKSDHLADAGHVARWAERVTEHRAALAQIATDARWERAPLRTASVLRAIYRGLPDAVALWHARDEFVPLDGARLRRAFRQLEGLAA